MQPPIRFEEFDLDVDRYELRRAGHAVKLERIPMELLILLLQSEGKLVRREVINRQLWGENSLQDTEHSVNTAVNKLRSILRDNPSKPRFIQTVVGKGYRFIAKVDIECGQADEQAAESLAGLSVSHSATRVAQQSSIAEDRRFPTPAAVVAGPEPLLPAQMLPALAQEAQVPWLRMGWFVLALLLGLAGILAGLRGRLPDQTAAASAPQFHSIAILPFANLAQNGDQDYIVDGMTDQLITDLASSTQLGVISRSSAMQFKGKQPTMRQIADTLHVDAVLEGSFLHDGKQVRITANLIDVRNDRHLWAQVYEESGDDLLSVQDGVARDIVREVAATLGSALSASRLRPVSVKAREAYLRGRFLWNRRTLASLRQAIDYYQQAITADPGYAEAYAAMGSAYVLMSSYGGVSPIAELEKAQQAAEHALQLGGGLAEAHTVLGAVRTDRDWDWPGAEMEYRRALQLNPSFPTARHWYSLHLSRLGRVREAETEIAHARALDPLSIIIATDAAETAYWARDPSEALKRINQVLALNPNFGEAHLVKGKIYEQQQQYEAALAEFKQALNLMGAAPNVIALQGHALALGGARASALSTARQLEEDSLQSYVSGVDIAEVYCALGQPDSAMRWLNRGYADRDKGMNMLFIDPLFDGCRKDEQFEAFVRRLKLQPAA